MGSCTISMFFHQRRKSIFFSMRISTFLASLSFIAFVIAGGVLLGYTKNNSNFVSLTGGTNFITYVIRGSGNSLLFVVWISLVLWMFNAWQEHVPHFLRDVFERRRIDVPAGDVNTHYLAFLKRYRDALRSPRRYLLIGSLLAIEAIYTSNGEKVRFV